MKHFTIEELTHSDTAIGHSIANNPGAVERENLRRLAERVLDPARERLGAPIYVNSGYRNCAVNRLVGGARRSYHLQGRAADLDTRSGRNAGPREGRSPRAGGPEEGNARPGFAAQSRRDSRTQTRSGPGSARGTSGSGPRPRGGA